MEGNLGKEDSNSAKDPQEKNAHVYTFKHAGSGHKRRRGSVQPSSSRAGKKSKSEIDKDYRERKKVKIDNLKAEMEELKKSNSHLEGQVFELRKFLEKTDENLKETREENFNLKSVQKSQSDSILELEKLTASGEEKMSALKAEHAQELQERDRKFNALKEEHERQMGVCGPWGIDVEYLLENAGEMNNPVGTPAPAQATSNFDNSDVHFASQMA
ncbi:uncharacterized protein [Populus alba]|uniref:uncharacterized protein isoform X3 n=1 Tax=Populus alba TaxID=43335 RepID=UPI003CC6E134